MKRKIYKSNICIRFYFFVINIWFIIRKKVQYNIFIYNWKLNIILYLFTNTFNNNSFFIHQYIQIYIEACKWVLKNMVKTLENQIKSMTIIKVMHVLTLNKRPKGGALLVYHYDCYTNNNLFKYVYFFC